MTLSTLMDDLQAASVQIWAEAGELRFRAPQGAMTEALRHRLKAMKPALLAELDPEVKRYAPFAQTAIQQAYVVGRTGALDQGGMAANSYIEFDKSIADPNHMEHALNAMIAQHDMLRTILLDNGQQQVLKSVPAYQLVVTDLRGLSEKEQNAYRNNLRHTMSQAKRDQRSWPLFEMSLTRSHSGWRLHTCIDLLILDAWSTKLFFGEWFARIAGKDIPDPPLIQFKECMDMAALKPPKLEQEYWREVLDKLPPAPKLPAPWPAAPETGQAKFLRFAAHVDAADWRAFVTQCRAHRVTPTSALATAFANTLSCWSENEDVALNLTLFDRPQVHPDVNRVLGEFTNTTLLGFEQMSRSFAAQAQDTQMQLLERLENSAISGVDLLRQLRQKAGNFSSAPMPVVLTSLLIGREEDERDTGDWTYVHGISQTPQVTLDHQLFRENGGLSFNWDVAKDALDLSAISTAFEAYCDLIHKLARQAETWNDPPSRRLPDAQRERRHAIHAPATECEGGCLVQEFWQRVEERSETPAVIWSGGRLSYKELAHASFVLSQHLRDVGVGPQDRVVIALEKGPQQIIAVLATLYLGAAYVPVDPEQPTTRKTAIFQQTDPVCVICDDAFKMGTVPHVSVTAREREAPKPLAEIIKGRHANDPLDQAYILFTSGTTGTPKGVSVSHAAALNTLVDMRARFGLGPSDRVLSVSALNFDLSVYDIFATLDAGGAIVLVDPKEERNPNHMWDNVVAHDVTVWNSVPAFLEMLITWVEGQSRKLPPTFRLALVSGDWVPLDLGARLHALSSARLIALGGATEAAIWSNWQDVAERAEHWTSVPYGHPLMRQYYRVHDKYGYERPDLVPGMLMIGGQGLATGYWRDPDQTNRTFRIHSGERLYETGDFGRFWPDQTLEFIGRKDQQVKLSGHRVELGEITTALERHPSVSRAVVSVQAGTLVAHVAGTGNEQTLKAHAMRHVPQYMVPRHIVVLDRLPLTANGKIDRSKLLPPSPSTIKNPGRKASKAGDVFSKLLGVSQVDAKRNFFELGLSSVDIVEAHRQLNACLPFDLPVADLFVHATLSALEEHLDRLQTLHKTNEDA